MTITLKNLSEATEQQVFDQVVKHLLIQGKRSIADNVGCAYRGEENLMCAAGCLIGDDEYNPELEGKAWVALVHAEKVPVKHSVFIRILQDVHDSHPPELWPALLTGIAYARNLDHSCVLKNTEMKLFVKGWAKPAV